MALLVDVRRRALDIVNPWLKNNGALIAYLTVVLELLVQATTLREIMKQGRHFKRLTIKQDKSNMALLYIGFSNNTSIMRNCTQRSGYQHEQKHRISRHTFAQTR